MRCRRKSKDQIRAAVMAVEELPPDVEEAAPLPPSTAVERRLNRIVTLFNDLHEEVSELRHDLRVRETFEDLRPSFPMRCSWPGEREA